MLSIGLNWLYIILTAFCIGYGIAHLVEKKLHYRLRGMDSILMAGLIAVTVYAEVFSLFYKVGRAANILLLLLCAGVAGVLHGPMRRSLESWWKETGAGSSTSAVVPSGTRRTSSVRVRERAISP